jgi:hypothetical protein
LGDSTNTSSPTSGKRSSLATKLKSDKGVTSIASIVSLTQNVVSAAPGGASKFKHTTRDLFYVKNPLYYNNIELPIKINVAERRKVINKINSLRTAVAALKLRIEKKWNVQCGYSNMKKKLQEQKQLQEMEKLTEVEEYAKKGINVLSVRFCVSRISILLFLIAIFLVYRFRSLLTKERCNHIASFMDMPPCVYCN